MRPLRYHPGQIAVQEEANSRELADRMTQWVGPAAEFAERADLLVFSHQGEDERLHFAALSGPPPLVAGAGPSALSVRRSPSGLPYGLLGGLAINLGEARRVRLNGELQTTADGDVLRIEEAFTLCRKYLARSIGVDDAVHTGPTAREAVPLDNPRLAEVVRRAETSFLASITPDGAPDVAHRGGPPSFLEFDAERRCLAWPEYLGDGVFKSAGNVRATSALTLLVPDLDTGDAYELIGRGRYTNLRPMRGARRDPLVRDREAFPAQGRIEVELERAELLPRFMAPRRRVERATKVTSQSRVEEQAPQ
jgi:hypothetical protein